MKKSKFLQSSKDMISRSFNPTKCKTSLRLAASRLKLLRNKKEVQLKQMKREIAQLLESGQDQTARIRVEHVIREEKMMAAYDLLEIYSELIVARLPIIETQKNCPIDLKEAIASLVFASPRCGDVPELLDLRKQFSSKYGKEFVSAAIELRPQSGVSRLLVEKLSARAPDGHTKIKILSAIAEEHNVEWDPKAFDDKHSGGPSSIKENEQYSEPPRYEAAEVQARPSNNINNSPLNYAHQDDRTSMGAENLPPAPTFSATTTFEPKARPAGNEMPQSFQGDRHNSHLNGWKMEFKDAAEAAQSAAESAERASMAARAAAELSIHGRILEQHSTESHNSDAYNPPSVNSFKRVSEASINKPSSENARLRNDLNEQIDSGIRRSNSRSNEAVPSKSKASADNDSSYHGFPPGNEYTQKTDLNDLSEDEMVMGKQSYSYETENYNSQPHKAEHFGEGMIGKQTSFSSSDYVNVFANSEEQKFENNEARVATFDKSDSENDDHWLDKGPVYDEQDLEFHLHSLGQKSPDRISVRADSWSPTSRSNNIVESTSPPSYFTREKSFDISETIIPREETEPDSLPPLRFDDSESDDDINASKAEDSRNLFHEQNERGRLVESHFEEEAGQSSIFGSKQFDADSEQKPYFDDPPLGFNDSRMELNDDHDSGEGLKFGKLTGGLRHKGHNHIPFFKNQLDESSSIEKERETTTSTFSSSISPPIVEHKSTVTTQEPHFASDSESSEEEEYIRSSSSYKQPHSAKKPDSKMILRSSNSIFGSHDSDLDEDSPRETIPKKSPLRSGISRRTKASATNSNSKMSLKSEPLDSDGVDRNPTTSYNTETPRIREPKANTRVSTEQPEYLKTSLMKQEYKQQPKSGIYDSDSEEEIEPLSRKSSRMGKSEQKISAETAAKPAYSSSSGISKKSNSDKAASDVVQKSKISEKSSDVAVSNTRRESSSENSRASAVEKPKPKLKPSLEKDDSSKRASHVHPKLPDYDSLVQSLRVNRS